MKSIKVVIDNNVTFSAFLFESQNCNNVLKKVIHKKIISYVSLEILKEFEEKLIAKFRVEKSKIHKLINFVLSISRLVKINKSVDVVRDTTDNMVIETALCANADYIITGDKDLLVLKKYEKIKILSPKEFLDVFNG